MNSFLTFKNITITHLLQTFKVDGREGGWGVNPEQVVTITNTTEALLIFENLYSDTVFELKDKTEKVKLFLTNRFNEIKTFNQYDIKTREVAFCALGLLILKDHSILDDAILLLEKGKCDEGGWGTMLDKKNPNLVATFQVGQLLDRLNHKTELPNWILQLAKEEGCIFNPSSNFKEKVSFSATAMVSYMLTHFYHDITHKSKYRIIESTKIILTGKFETIVNNVLIPIDEDIACEPKTGYHIFGFGLAALALRNQGTPIMNEFDIRNYLENLNQNYISLHTKQIPFILENSRLLRAIKLSYDPFQTTKDKHVDKLNDEIQELYEKLQKKRHEEIEQNFTVINIAIIYNSVKFLLAITICIVIFFTIDYENKPLIYFLTLLFISLSDFFESIRKVYSWITRIIIGATKKTLEEQMNVFNKVTDKEKK